VRKTVWGSVIALVVAVSSSFTLEADRGVAPGQKTTNDGIYSKAQADAAKPKFDKLCAECHAFTVGEKKQEKDLPLGDEPFLKKWEGRSLDELLTLIVTTMPNDGSAVVTDDEALNLLAYMLQKNGYKAGASPLNKAGAAAVLERPKK
jgi:cytochrome c5